VIPGVKDPAGNPVTEAGAAIAKQLGTPMQLPADILQRGLAWVADSFATTYWVAFALVLATFIPIAFLPRKRLAPPAGTEAGEGAEPVVMMH
jgi:hypothetical protein